MGEAARRKHTREQIQFGGCEVSFSDICNFARTQGWGSLAYVCAELWRYESGFQNVMRRLEASVRLGGTGGIRVDAVSKIPIADHDAFGDYDAAAIRATRVVCRVAFVCAFNITDASENGKYDYTTTVGKNVAVRVSQTQAVRDSA